MLGNPKTLEEAKRKRYGVWAGNPKGNRYKKGYCAYKVGSAFAYFHQCSRKNGHGIGKLYCKQHAKIMEGRDAS